MRTKIFLRIMNIDNHLCLSMMTLAYMITHTQAFGNHVITNQVKSQKHIACDLRNESGRNE